MSETPALSRRHEFVLLFDVTNGNPNGDPDAGNMPRMDPETGHGLVSDVCLKRKVRNYIELTKADASRHHIYVTEGAILNEKHREAFVRQYPNDPSVSKAAKLLPKTDKDAEEIRNFMCDNFYDIRAFGGMLATDINAGQVRGPVQFAFSRSVEPILPLEISITRMAATNEKEKKERREGDDEEKRGDKRTMGRKHVVPYGLYRAHGYISASLASHPTKGTGFTEDDLELLLRALETMFEHDHSAARSEMATRKLIVFRHASAMGNAPAHALFDLVRIGRNIDGVYRDVDDPSIGNYPPARKYADYAVQIDRANLPGEVEIIERV